MTAITRDADPVGTPAEPPEQPAEAAAAAAPPAPAADLPHPNGHAPVTVTPDTTPGGNIVPPGGDQAPSTRVTVRPRPRRRLTPRYRLTLALLAIVLVGVGATAGSAVADWMPKMYAAHADVLYPLVQEQPTGFLRQDRNLSTQEVLLASRTVLDPVSLEFGILVEDLADELETEVVEESEIIRIQFTDTSRAQARKVLVAILARYQEASNNPQRSQLRAYLDAQLVDVQARLGTARDDAAGAPLGLTQAALAQIDALVQREATLHSQIDEDQLAAIGGPAPLITVPPYVEHDAVSPQPALAIGGGALAGLVVALVVVAVLARRMTRP
jgi:capsular polysaccharide biosynthesis protein